MNPQWLQELRDLLVCASYDERMRAMQVWEARWTVDLHQRQSIDQCMMESSTSHLLEMMCEKMKMSLGAELATLMGELSIYQHEEIPRLDIRLDVLAIRSKPTFESELNNSP
jgi:hypothetical protein